MNSEKKKNLLLIGDLTPANNYGAIATTDMLKKIFYEKYGFNLKFIDHRSFIRPTPISGWDTYRSIQKEKTFVSKLYQIIKPLDKNNYILRAGSIMLRKNKFDENRKDIPYLFEDYEPTSQRMLNKETLQYEYELLKWADAIYINGEGNVVNGTDKYGVYRIGALYIFFLAYFAKKYLKKYCAIINHTVDPKNIDAEEIIRNLYPILDYIAVRETYSIKTLNKLGVHNVELVPDALFTFMSDKTNWEPSNLLKKEIDFTKPYICIGDSSAIRSRTNEVKWDVYEVYSKLIKQLNKITPQIIFVDGFNGSHETINKLINNHKIGRVNLMNCDYKELYYVLSKSEIFISGRWHASILSLLSGTPILLWSADSHKTKGLYSLINYPYKFFQIDTLPLHIGGIVDETNKILKNRIEISNAIIKEVQNLQEKAKNNIISDFE